MRFHITAAFVAAATLFSGAVADETITLTRTVQRVVQTVTATRDHSASLTTSIASASMHPTGYANGTVTTATLSATTTPVKATGAAAALNVEMIGMAAVAGLAGFLAL